MCDRLLINLWTCRLRYRWRIIVRDHPKGREFFECALYLCTDIRRQFVHVVVRVSVDVHIAREGGYHILHHIPLEKIGDAIAVFIREYICDLLICTPYIDRHFFDAVIGLTVKENCRHESLL